MTERPAPRHIPVLGREALALAAATFAIQLITRAGRRRARRAATTTPDPDEGALDTVVLRSGG